LFVNFFEKEIEMAKEKYFTEEIDCVICRNKVHMEVIQDIIGQIFF
jgi:hypothetical protein